MLCFWALASLSSCHSRRSLWSFAIKGTLPVILCSLRSWYPWFVSLFDAFCQSPEVLANQHAGHLELLAFGVDIAFALNEIICINVSWKAYIFRLVPHFLHFANQLLLSINLTFQWFRLHLAAFPNSRLCLGSCCCRPRTWRPWKIKTPRTTVSESGLVSGQVLPPGIGSAKLADSCMLVVALCCFLVPSSGAREVPRRFQAISISKQVFIVDVWYIYIYT